MRSSCWRATARSSSRPTSGGVPGGPSGDTLPLSRRSVRPDV
jgi:hypothetical protein